MGIAADIAEAARRVSEAVYEPQMRLHHPQCPAIAPGAAADVPCSRGCG